MNEDLTPGQLEVISKLYPRVQYFIGKGLTTRQIHDTLVVLEGWPVGAVQATIERVRTARPRSSTST
jgi:hypothetical protein